jgi:signal transduction histidine kinase
MSTDSVLGRSRILAAVSSNSPADRDDDRAQELFLAAMVSSSVTLIVVVGAAVMARRARHARRSTLGRLSALQEETQRWATNWLPETLARIERGERVDPMTLVPLRPRATDEDQIGQLATHIDQLVRIAAQTTMRQSQGRQGTEKVVGQLIRRAQTLIHRLINLLDDLERKHEDSDLLKDIFKVDHLATRVRRHTENLMILSGASSRHRSTPPTSITDVMRGAVAETEHYTRVRVVNTPDDRRVALAGRAVGDVTHLLAELIENGTQFSPPSNQVTVSAAQVAKGLTLHIEDQGLGIQPDQRKHANALLANPPRIDMTALGKDPRLGLFVVAKLAERHHIRVVLRASDYGGTLALVFLPSELLEVAPSPVLDQLQSAAVTTGRAVVNQPEAPSLVISEDRTGIDRDVLPGVGVGRGSLGEIITHSPAPDCSGFPEYGGAGLLPPASAHHAFPASDSAGWTSSASHALLVRSGPPAESTGAPANLSTESAEPPRQRPQTRPTSREHAVPGAMPSDTLNVPDVLPRRVKRASLAPELRREQTLSDPAVGESHGAFLNPEAAARTMAAIDAGLRRAGRNDESRRVHGQQDESALPNADER